MAAIPAYNELFCSHPTVMIMLPSVLPTACKKRRSPEGNMATVGCEQYS
jgi:hypothetical protein